MKCVALQTDFICVMFYSEAHKIFCSRPNHSSLNWKLSVENSY